MPYSLSACHVGDIRHVSWQRPVAYFAACRPHSPVRREPRLCSSAKAVVCVHVYGDHDMCAFPKRLEGFEPSANFTPCTPLNQGVRVPAVRTASVLTESTVSIAFL